MAKNKIRAGHEESRGSSAVVNGTMDPRDSVQAYRLDVLLCHIQPEADPLRYPMQGMLRVACPRGNNR